MTPLERRLLAALGTFLAEYAELDEMLDGFMADAEPSPDERRKQRANNRARDKVQELYIKEVNRA